MCVFSCVDVLRQKADPEALSVVLAGRLGRLWGFWFAMGDFSGCEPHMARWHQLTDSGT
jgi:hypothetical protein